MVGFMAAGRVRPLVVKPYFGEFCQVLGQGIDLGLSLWPQFQARWNLCPTMVRLACAVLSARKSGGRTAGCGTNQGS